MSSKRIYLSNSSIKTFLSCKRKFKYKYIDRIISNDHPSKYISFGNSMHKTLADFSKIKDEKYKTLDNLHNLLRKNWIREGYESIEEETSFGLWGLDMLAIYYKDPKDQGKENIIIEEMIYKNYESFTLCGKLDKVYKTNDGMTEIVDFKTSRSITTTDDLQLSIYLELVNSKLGYYPQAVSFYFLSENKKITQKVNTSYIEKANKKIYSLCKNILNEIEYTPSFNSYCHTNCSYFSLCECTKDESEIVIDALDEFKKQNHDKVIF